MSVPRPAMLVAIGDGPLAAGLGDDFGFAFVKLGVEHVVRMPLRVELARAVLALLDRHRTDQDRTAGLVDFANLFDHRIPFFLFACGRSCRDD